MDAEVAGFAAVVARTTMRTASSVIPRLATSLVLRTPTPSEIEPFSPIKNTQMQRASAKTAKNY